MARFYKTPYVQNIPDYGYELPFNEILGGLATKQKRFDEAAEIPDLIDDALLKIQPYFNEDKEALDQYRTNLYGTIDELTQSVNGDYSQIQPQLKNIARQLNRDMTQGDLAQIIVNSAQGQLTAKERSDLANREGGKYYDENLLANIGGGKEFLDKSNRTYDPTKGVTPYKHSWLHSKADEPEITNKLFSPLKADATSKGWFDVNTGWKTSESNKGIYKNKIYKTAVDNLQALDPNFKRELDYRVANTSDEDLIYNAGKFFINYYGEGIEGQKLAKQAFDDAITAAKNGDTTLLDQAYKAQYVGMQGEKFMFSDTDEKGDLDTTWATYLDEKKKELLPPTVVQTYSTNSEGSSIIENDLDKSLKNITLDNKGNIKNNVTVKSVDTGRGFVRYTMSDGTINSISIEELFKKTGITPEGSLLGELGVPFFSSTSDKYKEAISAYGKTLTSDDSKTVSSIDKIKETYSLGAILDNTGKIIELPEFNLTTESPKEVFELYTNATKDRSASTMFNVNSRPTDEKLMDRFNNQYIKDLDIVGRNIKLLDEGATNDGTEGTIDVVAADLGYKPEKFIEEFKKNASVVAIRPNSLIINVPDENGKLKQVSLSMAPNEKSYFEVSGTLTDAARSRTPISINKQLGDGTVITYHYKPVINKNKVSEQTKKKGVFEDIVTYEVTNLDGTKSKPTFISLEELTTLDVQYFLENKQQNK